MADQDHFHDTSENADWEAIARFVAGESSSEESIRVRQQLAADPVRAALVSALDESQHGRHIVPPTAGEVESALLAVRARREGTASRESSVPGVVVLAAYRRRWQDARLRAAAAVLVVAGVGLLWRTLSGPSAASLASANIQTHYVTAAGALDSARLPDGSRVLLGPGSDLTLANGFADGTRVVTLRGEARFDVVHDGSHPFIVQTSAASFRDVGTVFSVHSDAADGARIVVASGSVAVLPTGGSETVTLKAGDRAQVGTSGSLRVERAGATADDDAWTSGRLVLRDASIAQVTADLRRWYGVVLVVDSALANKSVTATCERCAAKDMGSIVAAVLGGTLQVKGDTLHVRAASEGLRK
ncbi:MAG: FecR domain-containing protein [bacterium]